jgi:3-phenylpropionate/trans-cinnamate dioxygenase ferredoxin reductase subunit
VPGLERAFVNATPGGMMRLAGALAGGRKEGVVVGAGFLGVETAATLAGLGHGVTVVDMVERPFDKLHDPLPALAAATLEELGVRFVGGAAITEVRAEGDQVTVCYKGGELRAAVVVASTGGRPAPLPGLDERGPLEVDASLRIAGLDAVYAIGDAVVVPHARYGPIVFPHWDMGIGTGEHAADAIAGVAGELDRLPYWWSEIGPRRLAEVGWAGAAVEWRHEDGLHVGRGSDGAIVCATVVDEPRRLREARALVLGA